MKSWSNRNLGLCVSSKHLVISILSIQCLPLISLTSSQVLTDICILSSLDWTNMLSNRLFRVCRILWDETTHIVGTILNISHQYRLIRPWPLLPGIIPWLTVHIKLVKLVVLLEDIVKQFEEICFNCQMILKVHICWVFFIPASFSNPVSSYYVDFIMRSFIVEIHIADISCRFECLCSLLDLICASLCSNNFLRICYHVASSQSPCWLVVIS